MNQEVVIWFLFGAALVYMGFRARKALLRKNTGGCGKNCGCETDKDAIHKSIS